MRRPRSACSTRSIWLLTAVLVDRRRSKASGRSRGMASRARLRDRRLGVSGWLSRRARYVRSTGGTDDLQRHHHVRVDRQPPAPAATAGEVTTPPRGLGARRPPSRRESSFGASPTSYNAPEQCLLGIPGSSAATSTARPRRTG